MPEQPAPPKPLSPWEWLPAALAPVLAAAALALGTESGFGRLLWYVCLALVPGILWRLAGKSSWTVHRLCFAVALILYMVGNPTLRPDAAALEKIAANWHLVAVGLALAFSQPLFGTLRWRRLLWDSGIRPSFYETFKLNLSGFFFNIFLPGATGGDIYRVYAVAAGAPGRVGPAVASITLDRFLGMPPLILLVLLAVAADRRFVFGNETLSRLMLFVFVAAAVCLVFLGYLLLTRGKTPDSARPGRLRRIHHLLVSNLSSPSTLPLTLLYGFAAHVAVATACLLFADAVGVVGIPPFRFYLLVPLAMSINAIPGSPGGIGQGEIAMAALFDMAAPGFGNAQSGVVVMLLLRLANVVIGLAGGVFYATGRVTLREAESALEKLQHGTDPCP